MKITRCAAGTLLWSMIGIANAIEGAPLMLTASAGYGYDSNLLRLSDAKPLSLFSTGGTRGDEYERYRAGIALNLPYKLQKFDAKMAWDRVDYAQYDFLDHTNSHLSGDWWWRFGKLWSGKAAYGRSRQLAALESFSTPNKEMVTFVNGTVTADYQLLPSWTLGAGLNDTKVERGRPELTLYDNEDQRMEVSVRYVGNPGNSVGLRASTSNVDYPNAWQVDGRSINVSYRETMLRATLDWSPPNASKISGSAGYDQVAHQQLDDRDFAGFTGRLLYNWDIGGRTRLEASLWREISPIVSTTSAISNYVSTEGISEAPTWSYSALLSFQLNLMKDSVDYGSGTMPTSAARVDRIRQASLALSYRPIQAALLSFIYDVGSRSSNAASVDYDYRSWTANAQIAF